ncbi:MAG: hydantoinase/oxoprolinase family protein, partial [Hyphomicrobiales bacterium]
MANGDGTAIKAGVDIGGTFTDVALDAHGRIHTAKVLTNQANPEQAILDGLRSAVGEAGIAFADISAIIHGTTLATNALIERRGARTAFITTEGFRDVIEMRTENRFEQYDLALTLPPPLIERRHRYTLPERIDAHGNVLRALDRRAVEDLVDRILARGYESVAVGLIHAYANGAHEHLVQQVFAERALDMSVSISCEVSPQIREFERFNTVCANAYVKPLMASYLNRLVERLHDAGAQCPVHIIHSGGGIIDVDTAVSFPVRLIESGPAGGAIFATHIAARYGLDRVLSFDMGGTTAKICLIDDMRPETAKTFEVARTYRFKKGSGMPISIPVIDMVEIGAGGGSIASVDAMSQIRVGPESAGSEPGPACYGHGGERPTVSDADLVLGRLDPHNFAGGSITLVTDDAKGAMTRDLGAPLGMDETQAAYGLCEVVDENMANAARVHAVENGKDMGNYAMIAFGGAAPIHAARLCDKLGIDRFLVPPGAGVGSALGFLLAPF